MLLIYRPANGNGLIDNYRTDESNVILEIQRIIVQIKSKNPENQFKRNVLVYPTIEKCP